MIRSGVGRACATLATVGVVLALWPAATAQAAPAPLSFTAKTVPINGAYPQGIATSDFNGDGHLDLATANEGSIDASGGVEILLGDGSGGFTDMGEIPAGANPISLDVGEFNGDGHVDLVVANHGSGDVSVLLGAGNGTFSAPVRTTRSGGGPACATAGGVSARRGEGGASQRRRPPGPRRGELPAATACRSCWATATAPSGRPRTSPPAPLRMRWRPPTSTVDGNLDVVAPNGSTAGATVLLGRGDGTLTALAAAGLHPRQPGSGSPRSRPVTSTGTATPIWSSPPATFSTADGST